MLRDRGYANGILATYGGRNANAKDLIVWWHRCTVSDAVVPYIPEARINRRFKLSSTVYRLPVLYWFNFFFSLLTFRGIRYAFEALVVFGSRPVGSLVCFPTSASVSFGYGVK